MSYLRISRGPEIKVAANQSGEQEWIVGNSRPAQPPQQVEDELPPTHPGLAELAGSVVGAEQE